MKNIKLGLVKGRHQIDGIEDYVFNSEIKDVTNIARLNDKVFQRLGADYGLQYNDHLDLYVTGLTVALGAVIHYCAFQNVHITLWYYDRESESYFSQYIF